MSDRRILVVGTTPDYIDHIHRHYTGRVLFLTDTVQRLNSAFTRPEAASEVVCNLADRTEVVESVSRHLKRHKMTVTALCCYDCEWLTLAAFLAEQFDCRYPSETTVQLARDKYRSKQVWYEQAVPSARTELICSVTQTPGLCERMNGPVVLKPLTGSGSELTFKCFDSYEVSMAYQELLEGLKRRSSEPKYAIDGGQTTTGQLVPPVLAEQWVSGREYSADFVVEDGRATLIRVARKIRADQRAFGTALAYVVPGRLPGHVGYDQLAVQLGIAARSLGLHRALCMADFMINESGVVMLELTPRIGGDCLPPLVRIAAGIDTIGLALDFAEGKPIQLPSVSDWNRAVGLRLLATEAGILTSVNMHGLVGDESVKEIYIKQSPGHEINLPPEDYSSWILGHVIFGVTSDDNITHRIDDILARISINVEQFNEQSPDWPYVDPGQTVQPSGPAA